MEYILIGILFILQLLSFFFIVLLNTKLAKYKDIEQKQQKLVEEMDNAIGAYLYEMKEENDRLIEELKEATKKNESITQLNTNAQTTVPQDNMVTTVSKKAAASVYERNIESHTAVAPVKANEILKQVGTITKTEESPKPLTFEQKVKKMFNDGQSIEQIAKKTNKGKTEIELLLKFSS